MLKKTVSSTTTTGDFSAKNEILKTVKPRVRSAAQRQPLKAPQMGTGAPNPELDIPGQKAANNPSATAQLQKSKSIKLLKEVARKSVKKAVL